MKNEFQTKNWNSDSGKFFYHNDPPMFETWRLFPNSTFKILSVTLRDADKKWYWNSIHLTITVIWLSYKFWNTREYYVIHFLLVNTILNVATFMNVRSCSKVKYYVINRYPYIIVWFEFNMNDINIVWKNWNVRKCTRLKRESVWLYRVHS